MKTILFLASLLLMQSYANAAPSFHCSNPPATKWAEYFVASGNFQSPTQITDMFYGIVEGSTAAGEEEPVITYESAKAAHDPKLQASSPEWKSATAFNLSTAELGQVVMYMHVEQMVSAGRGVARVKIKGKDLRIECTASK